jgi:hypothetical protein
MGSSALESIQADSKCLLLLHCCAQAPHLVLHGFSKLASEGTAVEFQGDSATQINIFLQEPLVSGCSIVADHAELLSVMVLVNMNLRRLPIVMVVGGYTSKA